MIVSILSLLFLLTIEAQDPATSYISKGKFLINGNYKMLFGLEIDKNCFTKAKKEAGEFEKTYSSMLDAINVCKTGRGFPALTYGLNEAFLSKIVLRCIDKGSDYFTDVANYSDGKLYLYIGKKTQITDPAAWFTEILYTLLTVDNMSKENRLLMEKEMLLFRDRISFWRDHCFNPVQVLFRNKNNEIKKLDSCYEPLNYSDVKYSAIIDKETKDRACGYYEKYDNEDGYYLLFSYKLHLLFQHKLLPAILEATQQNCCKTEELCIKANGKNYLRSDVRAATYQIQKILSKKYKGWAYKDIEEYLASALISLYELKELTSTTDYDGVYNLYCRYEKNAKCGHKTFCRTLAELKKYLKFYCGKIKGLGKPCKYSGNYPGCPLD